jgi:hypothetical protein
MPHGDFEQIDQPGSHAITAGLGAGGSKRRPQAPMTGGIAA